VPCLSRRGEREGEGPEKTLLLPIPEKRRRERPREKGRREKQPDLRINARVGRFQKILKSGRRTRQKAITAGEGSTARLGGKPTSGIKILRRLLCGLQGKEIRGLQKEERMRGGNGTQRIGKGFFKVSQVRWPVVSPKRERGRGGKSRKEKRVFSRFSVRKKN